MSARGKEEYAVATVLVKSTKSHDSNWSNGICVVPTLRNRLVSEFCFWTHLLFYKEIKKNSYFPDLSQYMKCHTGSPWLTISCLVTGWNYNSPLWLSFKFWRTHTHIPPVVTLLHFRSLASGLHLQRFAASCGHMTTMYEGFFCWKPVFKCSSGTKGLFNGHHICLMTMAFT